jgi:hypothetical protein
MRRLLFSFTLVALILVAAPAAFAAVQNLDPVTDPLGDCSTAATPDQCMALSSGPNAICTDSWGCPQCAMNQAMTSSICYRNFGNYGFCSCTANGTYVDKYGRTLPRCTISGSCNVR